MTFSRNVYSNQIIKLAKFLTNYSEFLNSKFTTSHSMSTPNQPALTGSCACGQISYTSSALPNEISNCHCVTCRKTTGNLYASFASFPTSSITWTSSSPDSLATTHYSKEAERAHCKECGSPISIVYYSSKERISIATGTIDEMSLKGVLPKVSEHIFVGKWERKGWYELPEDGLDRFERFTEGDERR